MIYQEIYDTLSRTLRSRISSMVLVRIPEFKCLWFE